VSGSHPRAAVVVLAAGSGSRVGHNINKVLLPLGGIPVFAWSLHAAAETRGVVRVVLVVAEQDRSFAELAVADARSPVDVIVGGQTRHESERLAVEWLAADIEAGALDVVAIHDAARPLASAELFSAVIAVAHDRGGAIPVRPQPAVIPADGTPMTAEGAESLVRAQTPQAFHAGSLLEAFRRAERERFAGTDTASCVEAYAPELDIAGVPGEAENLKITFADDLDVAERVLAVRMSRAAPAPEDPPRR
jgi:2-C-methyl-D-erythritol 4-phosphate cytidylyltransferase